jgi:ATP-binding cassette subfamily C protein CydC
MSALRESLRQTETSRWAVAKAVLAGTMALGSAVGLAAVAAWLIAKAAEMPSPADIALAAVIVRFFGISRGVFRYVERLASHDTALRGVVTLRTRTYDRLAASGASTVLGLRRGDIVARLGADLDAVGDAVVRAIIPSWVALTVSTLSVAIVAYFSPLAAASLAVGLVASAVLPSVLTARSTRIASDAGVQAQVQVTTVVQSALESASEHQVWGTGHAVRAELEQANRKAEAAADKAAVPAALSAGLQSFFAGASLVAGVAIGVLAVRDGDLAGPGGAVIALLPLAAFEAVGALPTAVTQYFRSRVAAERIEAMIGTRPGEVARGTATSSPESAPAAPASPASSAGARLGPVPTLKLSGLSAAWPTTPTREGSLPTAPLTAAVAPGHSLAVVGRSGIGKTTLLLTIAGALAPNAGSVTLDGSAVTMADTGPTIAMTPEDAHVFGTTVLENLRVARGELTPDDAHAALDAVGLSNWLRSLPEGLDTELGSGGNSISGGERRRLLLARALVSPAPIHLIDEPGEHLDSVGVIALRAVIATLRAQGRTVVIVTHDLSLLDLVDQTVSLDD